MTAHPLMGEVGSRLCQFMGTLSLCWTSGCLFGSSRGQEACLSLCPSTPQPCHDYDGMDLCFLLPSLLSSLCLFLSLSTSHFWRLCRAGFGLLWPLPPLPVSSRRRW